MMQELANFGAHLERPVSADAIEEALADSWRRIRSSLDAGSPIARASVLTLITCIVDPQQIGTAIEAIRGLSRQLPLRTMILVPDGQASEKALDAWHSTSCTGGAEQERIICSEQIVLLARGRAISYLPSLTDQLILTDLPAFLWWVGDLSPAEDPLFDRLTQLADRLIVDSSNFVALGSSLARLDRLARRRHRPSAPSDLNWARITPWRELIAQFFDAPTLRPHLGHFDDVEVEFDPTTRSGAPQALLLVSWLAERLRWQIDDVGSLQSDGTIVSRLQRPDGGPVCITRRPVGRGVGDGLERVVLSVTGTATFVVARESDRLHVLTEADVAGVPVLRRITRCEIPDLSALLADELLFFRRDHVYEAALRMAVDLSGEPGD